MIHVKGEYLDILERTQLLPCLIGLHSFHHWQALLLGDIVQAGDKDLQNFLRHRTDVHRYVGRDFFVKPVVVAMGMGEQHPCRRTAIKNL